LKKYTGNEVDEALRWVVDLLTKCQIPCFLTGETLKQVKDGYVLEVEKVEIGVKKNWLTQDTTGLLKTFAPEAVIGKTINLTGTGRAPEFNKSDISFASSTVKFPDI